MAKAKKERVTLTTPIFRVGYPNLFEPRAYEEGGKKKYDVCAIFTPALYTGVEKERWDALCAALDKATQSTFGMGWKEAKKVDPDTGDKAIGGFKEGLYSSKKREGKPGFDPGTFYATLSTEFQPGVVKFVKGSKSLEISEEVGNTEEIYAGIYARATVGIYAYDGKSKGVSIGLNNFQKVKDGERIDGRGAAGDDFEDDIDGSFLDQDEPAVEGDDPF